jgi:alpha-beta hydrolase superfamily lysophospholipase
MEIFKTISEFDGQTITSSLYLPDAPKALIVVFHGLMEHRHRYHDFAQTLEGAGYAVLCPDHRGHGDSPYDGKIYGYFADHNGWFVNLEDLQKIIYQTKIKTGPLNIILFGHSMGSLAARSYLKRFENELSGVILSGSSAYSPMVYVGRFLAQILSVFGKKQPSKLLFQMIFAPFNKGITPVRTPFDWLSVNEDNVDRYVADPKCGFVLPAKGYRDLFDGLLDVYQSKDWAVMRPDLPIHFVTGQFDAPAGFEKGVQHAIDTLKNEGYRNITSKIYPGVRHELLQEQIKEQVTADILLWCDELINTKAI